MNLEEHTNTAFSKTVASEKISQVLQNLALLTCRSDFSLSSADLMEIDQAEEAAHEMLGSYFRTIREKAAERRSNLERYADLDFISLGEDCLCRTIPAQWGLKRPAKMGEPSYPFDLAVHPLPRIAGLIETDFAGHTDPANLRFDEERKICRNEEFNIKFNHETGGKYAENGFALLRETYGRRIGNFRKRMAAGGRMVFLLHVTRQRPNAFYHIRNISRALRTRYPAVDFLMIAINTTSSIPLVEEWRRAKLVEDSVRIVDAAYPEEKYVWHLPKYCFAPEGHAFENKLIASIKEVVDGWR